MTTKKPHKSRARPVSERKNKQPSTPTNPKGAGNPNFKTFLNADLQKRIIKKLKASKCYPVTAARACGVTARNFEHWVEWGNAYEVALYGNDPAKPPNPNHEVYYNLFRALDQVDAQSEIDLLTPVVDRIQNWQANMTILERRNREHWANTEKHEITGKSGGPITFVIGKGYADNKPAV